MIPLAQSSWKWYLLPLVSLCLFLFRPPSWLMLSCASHSQWASARRSSLLSLPGIPAQGVARPSAMCCTVQKRMWSVPTHVYTYSSCVKIFMVDSVFSATICHLARFPQYLLFVRLLLIMEIPQNI